MALRFAFQRGNGEVSVLIAAPKERLELVLGEMTDEQYRAHVLERNGLTEAEVTELPEDWVAPDDRTFRDAWRLSGKRVGVDMDRARDIHMGRIRKARDAKMPALDVQFTRAQGRKDQAGADAVETERQKLRDIPQTFDLTKAGTPEELKALWPPELA